MHCPWRRLTRRRPWHQPLDPSRRPQHRHKRRPTVRRRCRPTVRRRFRQWFGRAMHRSLRRHERQPTVHPRFRQWFGRAPIAMRRRNRSFWISSHRWMWTGSNHRRSPFSHLRRQRNLRHHLGQGPTSRGPPFLRRLRQLQPSPARSLDTKTPPLELMSCLRSSKTANNARRHGRAVKFRSRKWRLDPHRCRSQQQ